MWFNSLVVFALFGWRIALSLGKAKKMLPFCSLTPTWRTLDLYRFNQEACDTLNVPITRVSDGRTPWQVMRDEEVMGRSGLDVCSRILKRQLMDAWRFKHTTPETHAFYLGLDWTEQHRMTGDAQRKGMVKTFAPWTVKAPMMDEPIWDKCRMQREWEALGFKLPKLYAMGIPAQQLRGILHQGRAGAFRAPAQDDAGALCLP